MDRFTRYWSRLTNKPLRVTGALASVAGLLILLNTTSRSAWHHVGVDLDLVPLCVLALWSPRQRS